MFKAIVGFVAGVICSLGIGRYLDRAGRAEVQQTMPGPSGWDHSKQEATPWK